MPSHDEIYQNHADDYDLMVSRQPSLLPVIENICDPRRKDIVDVGAGTGRLTTTLAPLAKSILALDASPEMLAVNKDKLDRSGITHAKFQVADVREIPLADNCADLVIAGWSICYLTNTFVPEYKHNLHEILREMKRVLRPGGTILIFETMGTGEGTPNPPEFLIPYYTLLEQDYGFSHRWIRLDYSFQSLNEAIRLTRFFFGEVLSQQVAREHWVTVPEYAGVWWLTP